jgi:hypothetical protein
MMQRIHSVESAQEKNAPLPGLLPLLLRPGGFMAIL